MRQRVKAAVGQYRRDAAFRAEVMLWANLAVNCVFALFEAAGGFLLRSLWMGTLAFYYFALALIRVFLLQGRRGDAREKRRRYRITGGAMLILLFVLLGIHCATLYMGHTIVYPGYMIYAMAAYTFYAVGMAIRNVIVSRKRQDPIDSAGKALNLAVAAISMYSLQSAMISAFGGGDERFRTIMSNCVGAIVLVLIAAISGAMVFRAEQK